jgi:uncharacterized Zn finger protein
MSTINTQFVLNAVRDVEKERLAKAVCGLADGSITVNVTGQSEREVKGFVANADGKRYGVSLTADRAFCSCPDSMFRHSICKHAVALALTVLRTPAAEAKREYHTGDIVERNGRSGKVVAVSGEFVSVAWDTGRMGPMTREQLAA